MCVEFAFLVDQRGRFIRSSTRIDWEGAPTSFALSYPYILAFDPDFIEIRNVHTVSLSREKKIRGLLSLSFLGSIGTSHPR